MGVQTRLAILKGSTTSRTSELRTSKATVSALRHSPESDSKPRERTAGAG